MSSEVSNKAIEILERTRDGDDLTSLDLKILESAVNGFLSEEGMEVFRKIYETVMAGEYVPADKRAFHGIEHLTKDNEGYVYWRGVQIEHYSYQVFGTDGWKEREKQAAQSLGAICRQMEAEGLVVTSFMSFMDWLDQKKEDCQCVAGRAFGPGHLPKQEAI
jgi:hypothetical protein